MAAHRVRRCAPPQPAARSLQPRAPFWAPDWPRSLPSHAFSRVAPLLPTLAALPSVCAADNKRVALWLKKKDEVKRFQNAVKESRLTAWRHAGAAHLALRMSLCTKYAAYLRSPRPAPRTLLHDY